MSFLSLPSSIPWLFWLLALAWSGVAQGVPGYHYGTYICDRDRKEASLSVRRLYGFHHAALYFTSSLAGFVAWLVLDHAVSPVEQWSQFSASTTAASVAIAAFAVLGVSGALARILYTGVKPW